MSVSMKLLRLLGMAAAAAALTLTAPTAASAVDLTPVSGQVVYAIAYKDNCNGSVDVAIGNATDESITIKVNGEPVSVEPMGIETVHVPAPDKGALKVVLKVVLGKGKPDKATHTWVKPALCVSPSPSASSAAPSTPPSSAAPSTPTGSLPVVDQPQLAKTGFDAKATGFAGVGIVLIGATLFWAGRQRRRARHSVS